MRSVWVAEDLESSGLESECLCGAGRGQVPRVLPSGAPLLQGWNGSLHPSPCPRGAEQPRRWETLLPCPASAPVMGNLVPAVTTARLKEASLARLRTEPRSGRVTGLGNLSPVLQSCTGEEGQQIIKKKKEEIL